MRHISIRHPTASEWRDYKTIRLEALKNNPTAYSTTYDEALEYSDDEWRRRITRGTRGAKQDCSLYLFAYDGEKVVGMVGAFWEDKSVLRHKAEVFGVYLNPEYREKGIGKRLLEAVLIEIKKNVQFTKIVLGVNASNSSALNLYESLGFKKSGKYVKEFLHNGVYSDEIVMEMLL